MKPITKKENQFFSILYLFMMIGGLVIIFLNLFNSYMAHGFVDVDYKPHLAIIGFIVTMGGLILLQLNQILFKLYGIKNGNNKT